MLLISSSVKKQEILLSRQQTAKPAIRLHFASLLLKYAKSRFSWDKACHLLKVIDYNDLSLVVRKPVFRVFDQVDINQAVQPQKMARGLNFRI